MLIEQVENVRTRAGTMHALTARPDGDGRYPPVIFYMDAPGYRPELEDMARRIAREGYFCILPDLYYRMGTIRLNYDRTQPGHTTVMQAIRANLTNQMVVEDTGSILAFLDARADVTRGPVGCVGHCMSGSFIVSVAAHFASRIAAASAFYGTRIITDAEDSPHLIAPRIKGEVYLSFAETDEYVPDDVPGRIEAILREAGVTTTIEVVPGTHHGYCFPERPAYHPEAAEGGWRKLFDLFERNLK